MNSADAPRALNHYPCTVRIGLSMNRIRPANTARTIAVGAAAGGAIFSFSGITGLFIAGGVLMLLAALLIAARVSVQTPRAVDEVGQASPI